MVTASEVDVGGCEVLQAFVISVIIVMAEESDDLALGLWMVGCSSNMIDALVFQPLGRFAVNVTGAIVRLKPWPVTDIDVIATGDQQGEFQGVCDITGIHRGAQLLCYDVAAVIIEEC